MDNYCLFFPISARGAQESRKKKTPANRFRADYNASKEKRPRNVDVVPGPSSEDTICRTLYLDVV